MGSDPNEKRKSKSSVPKKGEPVNFVVFRPTEGQKREIVQESLTMETCVRRLERFMQDGHRLILGYKAENGAWFVHIREGNADFVSAITLSCWHGDLHRSLQMMVYGLEKVYTEFPLVQLSFSQQAPDW
jgi:hypothetical protein